MRQNPAIQALHQAVNKAIAEGSPVFVNQPATVTDGYGNEVAADEMYEEVTTFARNWAIVHRDYASGPEIDRFVSYYTEHYPSGSASLTEVWNRGNWNLVA